MKKVFQSYDGLIFEDEDECVEYERDNPAFTMYGSYGKINDPNIASLVVIKDEPGAESFISMCNKDKIPYPGINRDSTGVFAWIHDQFYSDGHYIKISDDVFKALNHYLADIE